MAHSLMAARTPQAQDKYILRLPLGMRDRLKSEAQNNSRSLNAEMVQRLTESLELNVEHEDLWRELHKRDARIKQLEAESNATEKLLRETLDEYKAIVSKQDAVLQAVCYRVLQFKDSVPPDAFSLAENLINRMDHPGGGDWLAEDPEVALARYHAAIRKVVFSPADRTESVPNPRTEKALERAKQRRQAERAASKKDSAA
ncbi:Arc family DNA-binding protein [Rhizobium ruizarguesonis]|nr:Arc family DNA-binding protein [Rhizobium ruizarguesonis]